MRRSHLQLILEYARLMLFYHLISLGNENALFMRLHLLQGIVFYHRNDFDKAREFLQKAEEELQSLKVDDNQLVQLINLGETFFSTFIYEKIVASCGRKNC